MLESTSPGGVGKRPTAARRAILYFMSSPEERAALRLATWRGGVAHSFAAADDADLDFWLAATHAERLRAVTELIDEMRAMMGEDGPTPRLQRSVGGVRPRKG